MSGTFRNLTGPVGSRRVGLGRIGSGGIFKTLTGRVWSYVTRPDPIWLDLTWPAMFDPTCENDGALPNQGEGHEAFSRELLYIC